ncbi:MAG TPA: hypothetical protein VKC57_02610, partial [Ktedonobacterales bacterium]|nr:hypothetical protein [Ktedonobacterales bacterium]
IIGKLIPAGTGVEQRRQLKERQRADRLAAAMASSNLVAFGLGGTNTGSLIGGESGDGFSTSYDELPVVDSFPDE